MMKCQLVINWDPKRLLDRFKVHKIMTLLNSVFFICDGFPCLEL